VSIGVTTTNSHFRFWGVFSINATSHETAKEGFAAISKIGGVEPNERAAKSWLSSLEVPWLLIIDNADDPSVDIEAFFPEGERGFILVTTRVPENIKHGTVGPKSYQFEMLESGAANDLLLKAAQVKSPWDTTTVELASLITSALGCLPLALIHAGAAIANKLCELGSYLEYFKTFWETIRQAWKDSGQAETNDDKTYMSVYSSYEVIYRKLEEEKPEKNRDAVELLKIFAFFNRDNIRLEVLVAAAKNPGLKAAAEEKEKQEKKKSRIVEKPKSWTQLFRELLFGLRTEILKDRSQPILPRILRDVLRGSLTVKMFKFRLRNAFHVLRQWSLVTYHEENRSYTMHPLVHVWVRERPQMTLGEQSIWSQAAMNTLGQSILLPLSSEATKDEMELQRSLLLHVIYLRARKEEIREKILENQHAHSSLWPVVEPKSDLVITDRHRGEQAAKFSYIYFICGYWDEAAQLQEAVRDFLVPNLGLEHDASIGISRFLAKTYWLKGRFNDAGDLSEQVLQAAVRSLGEEHHTTLQIKDHLGTIRNYQGRFREAEDLFEQAIEGMKKTLGSNHQDTLCAIDNLGQCHWNYFAFEKAKDQHLKAIEGMKSHPNMGPTHEKTLIAKENLALAYREIGGEYLQPAHHLMEEVLNERSKILGRDQPYTLWAMSNLAYIKHAMGDHVEAENLIRKGMPIAERNLGEDHHGVLGAKRRLAEILAAQKRYQEAEDIFRRLLDPNKYVDAVRKEGPVKGDHKDRIYTLYKYVLFWEQQGKTKEALATCEEVCEVLGESKHPIAQFARDKRKDLRFLCGQTPNSV
jgi:tetratricopeptide (TPR) repeat protein